MKRIRQSLKTWEIRLRFPGWRLDWVSPSKAMLTSPEGKRYLIPYNPRPWSWQRLVTWLVPAVIWLWGMWMVCVGLLMLWRG